jgi:3D-(3,5/4)-trihydroxycyclohexane-1,2-dione acylhydrolase (decyclizing)
MLSSELATAAQEGIKIIVVLVVNHGFQSIGALSESVGAERFGTKYRTRGASGQLDGDKLPIDLAANAQSLGANVIRATTIDELREALAVARTNTTTTVVHIETDPTVGAPDSMSWWDVPIAEVATNRSAQEALVAYQTSVKAQRGYLRPTSLPDSDRAALN